MAEKCTGDEARPTRHNEVGAPVVAGSTTVYERSSGSHRFSEPAFGESFGGSLVFELRVHAHKPGPNCVLPLDVGEQSEHLVGVAYSPLNVARQAQILVRNPARNRSGISIDDKSKKILAKDISESADDVLRADGQ